MSDYLVNKINFKTLTGRLPPSSKNSFNLTDEAFEEFNKLKKVANDHGINLKIVSGFRDYERQKIIWDEKCLGKRHIYDEDDSIVKIQDLSTLEIIHYILRFSAIPGASRHHWGTEIDIIDASKIPLNGYELTPSEYEKNGPFEILGSWLNEYLYSKSSFTRPYQSDRQGVHPEPWHLSFKPQSDLFKKAYTFEVFEQNLNQSDIIFQEELIKNAREIYERFVINCD